MDGWVLCSLNIDNGFPTPKSLSCRIGSRVVALRNYGSLGGHLEYASKPQPALPLPSWRFSLRHLPEVHDFTHVLHEDVGSM
jgi:hypothetical protein